MKPDVNKPVENPILSGLLKEYRETPEEQKRDVLEKICEELAMKAYLLAVININKESLEDKGDGTATFTKDTNLSFEMFAAPDGSPFLPVYTDWKNLHAGGNYNDREVNTLIVSFDDIVAITGGKSGAVINPFSDNFVMPSQMITQMSERKSLLTKGYAERVVTKNTNVLIGEPAEYPTEMVNAISKYAKGNKDINAIWLKLMVSGVQKSFLLVVDAKEEPRSVFSKIGEVARPYLSEGMYIDMVPFSDDFGRGAAEGEPFYKRKRGLFR